MNCQSIEQKNPFLIKLGYRLILVEEGTISNPMLGDQTHSREVWERTVDGVVMQLERWLRDGVEKNSREYPADSQTAKIRRSRVLPFSRLSA